MVRYDPNLEGTALPTVPIGDERTVTKEMRAVRPLMREMVSKLRHLQELSIRPGNEYEEIAFVNSLVLLKKWSMPGTSQPNDISRRNQHFHVKGPRSWMVNIQKANILLWMRQPDGEKKYLNFKALPMQKIENIFDSARNVDLAYEDYQGKETSQPVSDIVEIGVSFYGYRNRSIDHTKTIGKY